MKDDELKARVLLAGQFTALGLLALPDRRRGRKTPGKLRKTVGWGLILGGGAFAAAGAAALGAELRPLPLPRPGARLQQGGPYAFTRHPIYAGIILAAAGRAVSTGGRRHAFAALTLAGVLQTKARFEEKLLGAVVPYQSYEASVPRWGVPLLRRRRK